MRLPRPLRLVVPLALGLGCSPKPPAEAPTGPVTSAVEEPLGEDDACPERLPAPAPLPGVTAAHESVESWLEWTAARHDLDEVLLDAASVARHNAAIAAGERDVTPLGSGIDPAALRAQIAERVDFVARRIEAGEYVASDGTRVDAAPLRALDPAALLPAPRMHLAPAHVQFLCVPLAAPLYTPALDLRFDRNLCSGARAHEPVEVLADWPADWRLVRTSYALGWVPVDVPLTGPLDAPHRELVHAGRWAAAPDGATIDLAGRSVVVPTHTRLVAGAEGVLLADGADVRAAAAPSGVHAPAALTRRNLLEAAFRYLGEPYGWGDQGAGWDCSRFVLDLLGEFGLAMPRFSATQALSGTFWVEVPDTMSGADRLLLFEEAAARGVVLLHFPGHIMLYLGRDGDGRAMAMHAFAEYLEPCDEGEGLEGRPETLRTVDRVAISDLSLGDRTSRRAFLDRVTRVTVIGHEAGDALRGAATHRPAAPAALDACPDDTQWAFFHSPLLPGADGTLRVIVTGSTPPASARLTLVDPASTVSRPDTLALGGPPWTLIADVQQPAAGTWRVALADGDDVLACGTAVVRSRTGEADTGDASGPAWRVRNAWDAHTEDLWAAFVERLFDYPVDEDLTWTNLHDILADPDRNVLFGHLGLDEEARLRLTPDCADLPYFVRAYFAWKLGLPFGYRECSRGRAGRPPACGPLITSLEQRGAGDDVDAFLHFVNRRVRNGVHSASGRTAPADDETDWYPIALDRAALRPGTVYADPYGHIMMLTRWVPQTADAYGILMAADAQPDATIGRRRFWRGTFLFTPETDSVGAGFKAWRPIVVGRDGQARALTNDELGPRGPFAAFSTQQYDGSVDDFYDALEAAINPRPLDARTALVALLDGLEESAVRRVNSVDNGEQWMRANRFPVVDMPSGAAIFQTVGPWEDYSTPSRDMRLLIAIDTVMDFADAMRRSPARFGLEADDAEAAIAAIERFRDEELARRTFAYTRSDGTPHTLSLHDVVARQQALETGWNPNDCAEIRWGAPDGSAEASTCTRRRPASQEPRMQEYRVWFTERRRPTR